MTPPSTASPLRVVAGVEARQPDAPHDRQRIGHRADRFRAVARCNTGDRRWRGFRRGNDYLRGMRPGHQRRGSDTQPAPPDRPLGRIGLSPRGRRSAAAKVHRARHLAGEDIGDPGAQYGTDRDSAHFHGKDTRIR